MRHPVTVLLSIIAWVLLTSVTYAEQSVGEISPTTSIIGSAASDQIGSNGVYQLPNGNVVIASKNWNGGMGAVTCLTPAEYQAGNIVVSASNSLVGDSVGDYVGAGVVLLTGSNHFVVGSPEWDNGATLNVGASTWVNGDTCIPAGEASKGVAVSSSNSLVGSSTSDFFGTSAKALSNGNYIASSSAWDDPLGAANVGIVIWANGATGSTGVISGAMGLIGSSVADGVGNSGIYELNNGNLLVVSLSWDNGSIVDAGAVTWLDASGSFVGVVGAGNSLVGTTNDDQVGSYGITRLDNGNYVVCSPQWDNGGTANVGAATWANGATGIFGSISPSNSLVGGTADDQICSNTSASTGTNNGYAVFSPQWDNGAATNAGAVTWVDGAIGLSGLVSSANSLVGDTTNDKIGESRVDLTNGNVVLISSSWHNNIGAATWMNGNTGLVGVVSAANSLVGSTANDGIEITTISLTNGNYVVIFSNWDDGATVDVGAVAWGDGANGTVGVISAANALIGATANDKIGSDVAVLTNGNYVVSSIDWDNGATTNVGATTWGNGLGGTVGVVSAANSLIGSTSNDGSSSSVYALNNGNYIITSPTWDNGAVANVGAVTWANGTTITTGVISPANSLIGASANDQISLRFPLTLSNGNYVVRSPNWDNTALSLTNVGAVTLGDGENGTVGVVSSTNSLIGDVAQDQIGFNDVFELANNNYVVTSIHHDDSDTVNIGSVTIGDGEQGTFGVVSAENSIVGTASNDLNNSGLVKITTLSTGGFMLIAPFWDNGAIVDVGAVVYSDGEISLPNLLENSSFETAGATVKKALNWTVKNPKPADRRICDTVSNPLTTADGDCVFQFSTTPTPSLARSLKQTLTGGDFGGAGETMTLSAFVSGSKFKTGAKIILTVTYTDNTTAKKTIAIPNGTYAFTEISGALNLTKTVKTITVNINVLKLTGRIRLDDLSLTVSATELLAFPSIDTRDGATPDSPAAPDGFRDGN